MKKTLNIVTLFDNTQEVLNYIKQQEQRIIDGSVDFVVVVNKDSSGEGKAAIKRYSKHIEGKIIIDDYNGNIGYLNAFLYSIRKHSLDSYDYIILSNTDVLFDSNVFYETLQIKEYDDNIGCIAPSVFAETTKSFSNPHYINRIKKRKILMLTFIFSSVLISRLYFFLARKKTGTQNIEKDSCFVYSPHGCFMIFTRKYASALIGCVYPPIMYSEESYIGETLRKVNMTCYYDRDLKICHNESTVTCRLPSRKKIGYMRKSLKYILREFY